MKKLKRVLMIVLMILVMSMTYYKAYAIKDNTKDYVSNDNNFIYSNSKTGTQSIDLEKAELDEYNYYYEEDSASSRIKEIMIRCLEMLLYFIPPVIAAIHIVNRVLIGDKLLKLIKENEIALSNSNQTVSLLENNSDFTNTKISYKRVKNLTKICFLACIISSILTVLFSFMKDPIIPYYTISDISLYCFWGAIFSLIIQRSKKEKLDKMVNTHLEAYNQFYSNSAINEAKEKYIEVKKKTISIIIVAIVCMFVSSFLVNYRRVPLIHKD